jgi:hypothetical protein
VGERPDNYKELRAKQGRLVVEKGFAHETHTLCWACGWTNYNQLHSPYSPRVKMHHTRQNMGLWDLGGQWVLRDEPNDASQSYDFMTQKFLRGQPGLDIRPGGSIPLVEDQIALSKPDDLTTFTLMRQAQGLSLVYLCPKLSEAQKAGYVRQMAAVIKALRQFTRPSPQKVDGSLLDDFIIGHCTTRHAPSCTKMGATIDAWLDNLEPTLRGGLSSLHETNHPTIIDAKMAELRASFPAGGPYYLTHGDLNMSNIIVKDDKISAIIDWEMAGFYPWWAERNFSQDYDDDSYELFEGVWKLLEPDLDHASMNKTVFTPLFKAVRIWGRCNINHPGQNDCWLRPAFSECEPAAGSVRWRDLGNEVKHKVCDEQWGAKDPHYPYR